MPNQKPMKWPLPEVVHPTETICYKIHVPRERHYIGAFLGAMFLLSKPYAWGDDDAHTALQVGAVWRAIFDQLVAGDCEPSAPLGQGGAEDTEMAIRQNPDNPCEIQSSADGTHWCTFIDLSLCFGNPPQPGGGSDQPQPGACASYHAQMLGNGFWLLPTGVSSGDTIEVSGASGVTYNGDHLSWYCPDGSTFILGACTSLTQTDSGNPLPTVFRSKLIAKIGSTFYDVFGGTFTVPSGHTNDPVTFQVNAATLSNNSGSIEFDVEVCNNQSGNVGITYSHGSGPASVPFGSVITLTAQDIGSDVRFDVTFDHPVKLTVISQSGYANTATPGPGDVWCGWSLGGVQVGTLADPPATLPTDFPSPQTMDAIGMDTGGPGTVFTVLVRLDNP